jgi:3-methyladenine DNA glycosylase/8-oxoguanine DNA glycosylase
MTVQDFTALEADIGFDSAVALTHLRERDAALARVIDAVGPYGLRPRPATSLFFALSEAIVYQQLTAKAAGTIFGRVCALFPDTAEGFCPPELLRLSDAKLRTAGLSGSKLASLRDLARRTHGGQLPSWAEVQSMEDEAIIARLSEVRGIGRWTAQMLLIFRLGRPDVLPVDDYGIRKGFARAFRKRALPAPADVEKRGVRWKPYRTVASWYLWRGLEVSPPRRP